MAGYPVVDTKVTLFDGSYHDVDSDEISFRMAAIFGFKDGFRKAKPIILEPIMKVEVVTPEDYMGDVIGDLNRRRGQIQGMEDTPAGKTVTAEVPLSEMFGYATNVRSMSQGRATFTMEFAKYMEVPPNIADGIINKLVTTQLRPLFRSSLSCRRKSLNVTSRTSTSARSATSTMARRR